jgi:hypothetical protein
MMAPLRGQDRDTMPPAGSLDRRQVLLGFAGLVAAAATGIGPAGAATELDASAFRALSFGLMGRIAEDPSLAEAYLAALRERVAPGDLERLAAVVREHAGSGMDAAITRAGLDAVANQVIAAWYTGTVPTATGSRVVTYLDAVAWKATGFTKPPSVCGPGFGFWANPPR